MKKPMIYYSHPIAGKNVPDKDFNHENSNCDIAAENIKWLRERFPQVRWYCPGEVELPVQTARILNLLTVPQVLDIDFYIIKNRCRGGLLHPWEPSSGLEKEQIHLNDFRYPNVRIKGSTNIWECDLDKIWGLVEEVLESSKEHPEAGLQ